MRVTVQFRSRVQSLNVTVEAFLFSSQEDKTSSREVNVSTHKVIPDVHEDNTSTRKVIPGVHEDKASTREVIPGTRKVIGSTRKNVSGFSSIHFNLLIKKLRFLLLPL